MPPHRIYVEPYGGGGSVLLKKPRSYAEIYNDLDGEIVNVFRMARDCGVELVRALELTPFSRAELLLSYEPASDTLEQARRTITRSFMGFGSDSVCGAISGFRANSNRSGTTPAQDWRNYPTALVKIIERLRGVVIEQKNAIDVMRQHDGMDTMHYVDPPYVHNTRSTNSRKSYKHEMTDDDHCALAEALHALQGAVIVSGYRGSLYDELFADWRREEINAFADGARKRTEVIWFSPNCLQNQINLIDRS